MLTPLKPEERFEWGTRLGVKQIPFGNDRKKTVLPSCRKAVHEEFALAVLAVIPEGNLLRFSFK